MRQIVLDTETTGLDLSLGHRVIEIGCVELQNRRHTGRTFHRYLNPEREIDEGALAVHGISRAHLDAQPLFGAVANELMDFIGGAELVIHNAAFDVAFLDAELARLPGESRQLAQVCQVLDTLSLARELHPGQRNSLDALCKRYDVDNSRRELHGALLDARILADIYLAMTGGQGALALMDSDANVRDGGESTAVRALARGAEILHVVPADAAELSAHEAMLALIDRASGGRCVWLAGEAAARREEEQLRVVVEPPRLPAILEPQRSSA